MSAADLRPSHASTPAPPLLPSGSGLGSDAPTPCAHAAPVRAVRFELEQDTEERQCAFLEIIDTARACRRCPRMEGRTRAIGPANGPLDARILFIAEAPGRLGADVTGVPLSGDQTGRTFDRLLAGAGIERRGVFVTNAVLCNPRRPDGRNDRPRSSEVANCSGHLRAIIDVLQPLWVVSLGRAALDALAQIERHDRVLARDVGAATAWYGRRLVPLYHPGPRAVARRGFGQHAADYAALAALITA